MKVATLKEAKSRLDELILRAEQGETIIIKRNGKTAVRLTPVTETELALSAAEARKLDAWADDERAAGRTKVFESPAEYAVHVRTKRARKGTSR
jgi:prevent-host-death family protein